MANEARCGRDAVALTFVALLVTLAAFGWIVQAVRDENDSDA